ncbi:MAG: hypothetical protein Q9196_007380, partial [Gyalolechia fulgens]
MEFKREIGRLQDDHKALRYDHKAPRYDHEALRYDTKTLQDDTKTLQDATKALQDDIKALRAATQAVQFILGGVATREWVDHGILGRRIGSAWSHNHLFLEPVDEAAPKIAPTDQFDQQAHWVTIAQAHEETARRPQTIKAQYCKNTDSRNPIGQKGIIQSYT